MNKENCALKLVDKIILENNALNVFCSQTQKLKKKKFLLFKEYKNKKSKTWSSF